MAVLPDAETAAREIVRALILQNRKINGQEIAFIRKKMKLKATELADILGVHRVAVSRWENDRVQIQDDYRLRLAAVDRIFGKGEAADELILRLSKVVHRPLTKRQTAGDRIILFDNTNLSEAPNDLRRAGPEDDSDVSSQRSEVSVIASHDVTPDEDMPGSRTKKSARAAADSGSRTFGGLVSSESGYR
jgi:transcriptional regulator with XRE-family HTH domain